MGATLERMGGEEGIVPERSEWFRSTSVYRKEEGVENRWLKTVGRELRQPRSCQDNFVTFFQKK